MHKHHPKATENITDSIRSGEYFNQARKWYFILFSNPIAERSFYLLTLAVAVFTLLIAATSLVYILPVSEPYAFLLQNNHMDKTIPRIVRLRKDSSESQDVAMMRYFARTYVEQRETYSVDSFELSGKFMANYSDEATYRGYLQLMDTANPSSPRLLFADPWLKRFIEPTSVQLNLDTQPYQALVRFNASIRGNNQTDVVSYTADLRFLYSPLQAVSELDSVTGEKVIRFKQPEFQVVSYHVQQSAASSTATGYDVVR